MASPPPPPRRPISSRRISPLSATRAGVADCSRRRLLGASAAGLLTVASSSSAVPRPARAAATLPEDEAIERLRAGRRTAQYLLDNYSEICDGGGDNVRRYLGTVGTTSGLLNVGKTLAALRDRADDIVEYTETADEVEKCIQQADGSAYMAIFVTTSTSYDPPSKYFDQGKVEVKRLVVALDKVAGLINVTY